MKEYHFIQVDVFTKPRAVPVAEPATFIVREQGAEIGWPSTLYVEVGRFSDARSC